MNRATGLLIIEVNNSNPNGNPDQESDPRLRPDERGMISAVSVKRKLRDLVEDKDGPVWLGVANSFEAPLAANRFQILESRGRNRAEILALKREDFIGRYWDARLFGTTFLQSDETGFVQTGVVQFGMGVSVSPVEVERMTTTNKAGVETDKTRGMAPLAFRVVSHGVYVMPYFVNPAAARKSGCDDTDIELMERLIPYVYTHTASYIRPMVTIRHAWHIEHTSALGSCPDFALLEALSPKRTRDEDKEVPSKSWQDYIVPQELPKDMASRVRPMIDLITQL
jgi:Cas7 group CRISPR-associated protein Csh2